MEWECNECAEAENGYAPCRLETPEWMGDERPTRCVITDAECGWQGPIIRTEDAIQSEEQSKD